MQPRRMAGPATVPLLQVGPPPMVRRLTTAGRETSGNNGPYFTPIARLGPAELPGYSSASARLLVGSGLPDPAALRRRDGRRHLPPRHHAARAGPPTLGRRLRAALPPAERWPLRRKPQPPAALLSVPGDHEAEPGGRAGAAAGQLPRPRPRPLAARFPLRRGRLGEPHARRLGPGLGGVVRRHGGGAVHLFPAGRRHHHGPAQLRDDLWARAAGDVRAGRRERLRARFQRPRRHAMATSSCAPSENTAPTISNTPTPRC